MDVRTLRKRIRGFDGFIKITGRKKKEAIKILFIIKERGTFEIKKRARQKRKRVKGG